jgi:hypothetical protein
MKICLRISGRATVELVKARAEVGRTPMVFALARIPVTDAAIEVVVGVVVAVPDIRTMELDGIPEASRVSTGVCRGVGGS